MRNFLWGQDSLTTGKAKVAWSLVCFPKQEGGLGVRRVAEVNNALMTYHVYSILSHRKCLWVQWIHAYRLNNRSFWDIPMQSNVCWSWRKLLAIRPNIRNFIWTEIGNGQTTSLWFDRWCDLCPLSSYVSPRQMNHEGLSIISMVSDVVQEPRWEWPDTLRTEVPILNQLRPLCLNVSKPDVIKWRNEDGSLDWFSSKLAWNALRRQGQEISWHNLVWSSFAIPRHAFMSWLIFRRKLSTQDKIQKWSVAKGSMNLMCCLLCYKGIDSHNHLFFECEYSNQIWCSLRSKVGMSHIQGKWEDIVTWLIPRAKCKSARVVIAKLLIPAIAYYIWQERNLRFFNNQLRPPEKVRDVIVTTIRLKLHSLKFRMNARVRRILEVWNVTSMDVMLED